MKRQYSKPTIHVEVMSLDMPVASTCNAHDDSFELRAQGWFTAGSCDAYVFDGEDGWFSELSGIGDTVCYHSGIRTAFSS